MTTAELIKALRVCSRRTDCKGCGACPLFDSEDCMGDMMVGAADLIERLTAENAVLPNGEASAVESLRKEIEWKDMVIALAQRKQAEAEAERDAALADLADARSCKTCKYACDTRDCSSCKSKTCKCRECHLDKNAWEWRGLPGAPEEKHESV